MSWNTAGKNKKTTEVETLRLCYLEWIELCGDSMVETSGCGVPSFLKELLIRARRFNINHFVHLANGYRFQNGVDALWRMLEQQKEHTFWYNCLVYVCYVQDREMLFKLIKGIGIGEQWNIFELVFDSDADNFWRTSSRVWGEFLKVFDELRGRAKEKERLRTQFETWKEEYIKIGRTLPSDDQLSETEKEFRLENILESEFPFELLKK